jgi:hypothetical protein
MPNISRLAKAGTVLLAVLVAVTGYAALHPQLAKPARASS